MTKNTGHMAWLKAAGIDPSPLWLQPDNWNSFGRVLDGEPPVEKLVGLEVWARQFALRVVVLGKEARRAQHEAGQAVQAMHQCAQLLRRELRD